MANKPPIIYEEHSIEETRTRMDERHDEPLEVRGILTVDEYNARINFAHRGFLARHREFRESDIFVVNAKNNVPLWKVKHQEYEHNDGSRALEAHCNLLNGELRLKIQELLNGIFSFEEEKPAQYPFYYWYNINIAQPNAILHRKDELNACKATLVKADEMREKLALDIRADFYESLILGINIPSAYRKEYFPLIDAEEIKVREAIARITKRICDARRKFGKYFTKARNDEFL